MYEAAIKFSHFSVIFLCSANGEKSFNTQSSNIHVAMMYTVNVCVMYALWFLCIFISEDNLQPSVDPSWARLLIRVYVLVQYINIIYSI